MAGIHRQRLDPTAEGQLRIPSCPGARRTSSRSFDLPGPRFSFGRDDFGCRAPGLRRRLAILPRSPPKLVVTLSFNSDGQ